jgi:ribosomal protein S19E (S16A)
MLKNTPFAWSHTLANEFLGAMFRRFQDDVNAYQDAIMGLESSDRTLCQYAYSLDPEVLDLAVMFKRTPYANPEVYREQLESAAKRGWLKTAGDGAYRISEKGADYVKGLIERFSAGLAGISDLDAAQVARAIALIDKVNQTIAALPEPVEKHAWKIAQAFAKGQEKLSANYRLRRHGIDLLSFRDDAHIAAWSQHAVEGYVFEAFSLVWAGEASTAAEILAERDYRNYPVETYQTALEQLVERGWLKSEGEGFAVSEEGAHLRDMIEDQTNTFYNAAFSGLSEAEQQELKSLFEGFAAALKTEPVTS